jgi:hypothetical protein
VKKLSLPSKVIAVIERNQCFAPVEKSEMRMLYECFFRDAFGHVTGGKIIQAADDKSALAAAGPVAKEDGALEVWSGARLVGSKRTVLLKPRINKMSNDASGRPTPQKSD